ncbi:ATP-dependent RNA helicase [Lachnellula occidentalis]|uniref:ATP-dependent RNA helicase n=1 Tax=Lachnellula occidentalis TaxID=215460 RepID=A0A8H8U5J9_9HELO|nr:ATP-dependent RNA helicase [Lachnellula occidentalis]
MTSQIYARYIPPVKKSRDPDTILQAVNPTPALPAAQIDPSSTYARYIPPPKPKSSHPSEPDGERSPKRLKKNKEDKRSSIQKENVVPIPNQEPGPKKSTPRKEKQEETDAGELGHVSTQKLPVNEDARHEKLMKRREKSLRKAAKLAEQLGEEPQPQPVEEDFPEPTEPHDLLPLPQPEPVPELPLQSTTSVLPSWLASPIRVSHSTTAQFKDIGIQESTASALTSKGLREAFAVQAAVLPLLLPGPSQQPGDILVSAATGSGKTLAYVLPMIEALSRHRVTKLRGVIVVPTRELVTQLRDVSDICASAFSSERDRRRVKIGTAIGSGNFKTEQSALMDQQLTYDPKKYQALISRLNSKWQADSDADYEYLFGEEESAPALPDHVIESSSKIDVLICTPGRLVEHLKSTPGFSLQDLTWLIVDEADKLLDQSFQQWLDVVNGQLPQPSRLGRREHIQKIILSATMTKDVGQLNSLKLYRPKLIVLEGSASTESTESGHVLPSLLTESAIKVEDEGIKPLYLLEILKRQSLLVPTKSRSTSPTDSSESDSSESETDTSDDEAPTLQKLSLSAEPVDGDAPDEFETTATPRGVLIFTKSNESALRLGRLIAILEPDSSALVATLTSTTRSSTRTAALRSFQSGKLSILVASDLVSRGLDLPNLAHVINYDVPGSITSYVHRVGRTARAGKPGHAWTLFTGTEGRWFWNEIGRSTAIERLAESKVERVNIKASLFDGEKERYEAALEKLGEEASGSKP